jgi:hypothetical protein
MQKNRPVGGFFDEIDGADEVIGDSLRFKSAPPITSPGRFGNT